MAIKLTFPPYNPPQSWNLRVSFGPESVTALRRRFLTAGTMEGFRPWHSFKMHSRSVYWPLNRSCFCTFPQLTHSGLAVLLDPIFMYRWFTRSNTHFILRKNRCAPNLSVDNIAPSILAGNAAAIVTSAGLVSGPYCTSRGGNIDSIQCVAWVASAASCLWVVYWLQ